MKPVTLIAAMILSAYSTFAQNSNALLGNYLQIKEAMVAGNSKEASNAATAMQQTINSGVDFKQKNELTKAIESIQKADNIETQRAAFACVSTITWSVIKASDSLKQEVYYQYCPMKKAYWLSAEPSVRNPYYVASMLSCGKVTETKKAGR